MKRTLFIAAALSLAFAAQGFAQKTGPGRPLDFQRYDRYFERNDSRLTGQNSYLVFTSYDEFYKVLMPAAGEKQFFLPDDVFDHKVVVATIARGNFLRTYDSTKVTTKGGKLYVWYTVKDSQPSSATFATPLIVTVDKAKYSQVIFMQDGKKVGSAMFPKSKH